MTPLTSSIKVQAAVSKSGHVFNLVSEAKKGGKRDRSFTGQEKRATRTETASNELDENLINFYLHWRWACVQF